MKMKKCINLNDEVQEEKSVSIELEGLARHGAQQMLQQALENEVAEYLTMHAHKKDDAGHNQVVRNGYHKAREIVTGIGKITIQQPRAVDEEKRQSFISSLLPRYMRRMPSIDNLIPILYLKGISTGDFTETLTAILGPQASGLSAANIVRLKQQWEIEYAEWNKRRFDDKKYVYVWADGIYFNVRLDDVRQCMLVIIGTTETGEKELITIRAGYRESKQSWKEILIDLQQRGLTCAPRLAIGDGSLGFWAAIEELFPVTRHQRCWVHKTANILDKLPKSMQSQAKAQIHEMYLSPTKRLAIAAYDSFLKQYDSKYPAACECLRKDRESLFTFYDFPAEHWVHIRTTNPIESTFATVRHRTHRTKGCCSRMTILTMVFKLVREAEKTWNRLRGYAFLPAVFNGEVFIDGERKTA